MNIRNERRDRDNLSHSRLGILLAGIVIAGVGIVACSGSQSADGGGTGKCGAGTALVNGECLPADAGAGGPDADATDATGAVKDDPCPAKIDVNCSDTCGPRDSCWWGCEDAGAPQVIELPEIVNPNVIGSFTIRTPRDFATEKPCNRLCVARPVDPPLAKFAYGVKVHIPPASNFPGATDRMRVLVEPPFYVGTDTDYYTLGCFQAPARTHCVPVHDIGTTFNLFVLPGTTVAHAQNVVIDSVPAGQPVCP